MHEIHDALYYADDAATRYVVLILTGINPKPTKTELGEAVAFCGAAITTAHQNLNGFWEWVARRRLKAEGFASAWLADREEGQHIPWWINQVANNVRFLALIAGETEEAMLAGMAASLARSLDVAEFVPEE